MMAIITWQAAAVGVTVTVVVVVIVTVKLVAWAVEVMVSLATALATNEVGARTSFTCVDKSTSISFTSRCKTHDAQTRTHTGKRACTHTHTCQLITQSECNCMHRRDTSTPLHTNAYTLTHTPPH